MSLSGAKIEQPKGNIYLHTVQADVTFVKDRLTNIPHYYMAMSHEDWELQNSRI